MAADNRGLLVADYEIPQALIVPHGNFTIRSTLESIAEEASQYIGIILLSPDPKQSRVFIEKCSFTERFSIVAASFDTPWIRDRSPIAVGSNKGYQWLNPNAHMTERKLDSNLFNSIVNRTIVDVDIILPQGNLVGGPDGLAISTDRVLTDNRIETVKDLVRFKQQLGIREWLLIRPVSEDTIAHADCYVRFLSREIVALAHNPNDHLLSEVMEAVKAEIRNLYPRMHFIRIPVNMRDGMLESPLNWIQVGQVLFVPLFPGTTPLILEQLCNKLEKFSFHLVFVSSPTTSYGGALHCLTASVFG